MDISVDVGISERTIKRVSLALSMGIEPNDIEDLLRKDGISERDIYLTLIAGDVHNRMSEKEFHLHMSDL